MFAFFVDYYFGREAKYISIIIYSENFQFIKVNLRTHIHISKMIQKHKQNNENAITFLDNTIYFSRSTKKQLFDKKNNRKVLSNLA